MSMIHSLLTFMLLSMALVDSCRIQPPYNGISLVRIDVPHSHPVWKQLATLCELRYFGDIKQSKVLLTRKQLSVANRLDRVKVKVLIGNVGPALSKEKSDCVASYRKQMRESLRSDFYMKFRLYNDYLTRWRAITKLHRATCLTQIGRSAQGRPLHAIRIGDKNAPKRILVIFGMHAREWASVAAGTYAVEHFTRFTPPRNIELVIVPLLNPDGYIYSMRKDRLWRKNRGRARCGNDTLAGVDLNRNWAKQWGGPEMTSKNPCSEIYIGPRAFSEPETKAIHKLTMSMKGLVGFLDVHSFAQLIIGPWSYSNVKPPKVKTVDAIGEALARAASKGGAMYLYGRGASNNMYLASGISSDWFTARNITASYTMEIRPRYQDANEKPPYGFTLQPELIRPASEDVVRVIDTLLVYGTQGLDAISSVE